MLLISKQSSCFIYIYIFPFFFPLLTRLQLHNKLFSGTHFNRNSPLWQIKDLNFNPSKHNIAQALIQCNNKRQKHTLLIKHLCRKYQLRFLFFFLSNFKQSSHKTKEKKTKSKTLEKLQPCIQLIDKSVQFFFLLFVEH